MKDFVEYFMPFNLLKKVVMRTLLTLSHHQIYRELHKEVHLSMDMIRGKDF